MTCLLLVLAIILAWPRATWAADTAAGAAPAAPTHRPLRENQPSSVPEPTEPGTFSGYPGAQPFSVVPRRDQLSLYPCSQCHNALPLNNKVRKLDAAPHAAALQHGGGRMWCLDCHEGKDRDVLHSLAGAKIDFNESSLLCGQCHSARYKDWIFGAHGKRVAGWQGERQLYACTHCHDPHNPVIQPRAPAKAPPVRAGLAPMNGARANAPLPWQRNERGKGDDRTAKP